MTTGMFPRGGGCSRIFSQRPGCFFALLRSEEHTSELQSRENLVCRLLLVYDAASTISYALSLHDALPIFAALVVMAGFDHIPWSTAWAIGGGGACVAMVGFLDDHGHVSARWRLLAHFLAAAWVLFCFA